MSAARRVIAVTLLVGAIAALGVAAYNAHERSIGDAFFYLIFFREDRTTFAAGFSDEKFDKVQLGMSEAQVAAILGEPLLKQPCHSDRCYWRYSGGPPDSNFWQRVISFEDGRVSHKLADYFVD